MIESLEQRRFVLSKAGEDLEFDLGIIKGIPGHLVYNVQSFDSPYDVEKQDFNFQILSEDFFENELAIGDTFIYTLNERFYTFEITAHIEDLIGWVELKVKCTGVEV